MSSLPFLAGLKQTALTTVEPGSSLEERFYGVQVSVGSSHL